MLAWPRDASRGPRRKDHMADSASKVPLVTGAARGIGAAVASRLAADGFQVVLNYAGSAAEAQQLASKLEADGGKAWAIQADVGKSAAVSGMFDAIEKRAGGLHVLVNNAGIMLLSSIAETDEVSFDRQIEVNLKGTFNTLREAAKRLRTGGRIINFSSSVVGLLQPTYGVYAATKAAVEALTPILAKELRGRSITVNTVAPGPTSTELFLRGKPQQLVDQLSKLAPLERLGQPDDIARVVSFLAGPDGAWVNGQTLRANGGII
jgi:3-oxoacyl-[acyl-carrier protein] reductase